MRTISITTWIAATATLVTSSAVPVNPEKDVTVNTLRVLSKRDSFSCAGSSFCGSEPSMARVCDDAINTLRRGGTYQYAASTPGVDSGNCRQLPDGWGRGCGIFLEGPSDCKGMGDDMWWGAQQIRGNNCRACGFKTFTGERGGACRLTINYVTGCNN